MYKLKKILPNYTLLLYVKKCLRTAGRISRWFFKSAVFNYFIDFVALVFPRICLGCGRSLLRFEKMLCLQCLYRLPETRYHMFEGNPVEQIFWGRIKIERAASFLFFNKGGLTQKLLHALKYKKRREAGLFLGEMYGQKLKETVPFCDADMIIPVPLHPRKKRKRGYNQSEVIAKGISKVLKIPVCNDILLRKRNSSTQTRKNRFQRWKNVETIFSAKEQGFLQDKHILLVDDVVTTGATLEACIRSINTNPGAKVSILTIAYAWK